MDNDETAPAVHRNLHRRNDTIGNNDNDYLRCAIHKIRANIPRRKPRQDALYKKNFNNPKSAEGDGYKKRSRMFVEIGRNDKGE